MPTLPIPEKFRGHAAVSPLEAAEICGIDRTTLYRRVMPFVYSGEIRSVTIGASRRIFVNSLLEWLDAQSEQQRD